MTRQQPRRRTETVVCAEVTNPIHKSRWRRAWNEVIPFLDYPPEVRRLICTTNAIEALNSKIRRAVRTRGHFPSDEAAAKLIYLALNATSAEWKRSVREWHAVKSQLAIMFEERFPMA
jgi:putative transposase